MPRELLANPLFSGILPKLTDVNLQWSHPALQRSRSIVAVPSTAELIAHFTAIPLYIVP
jgi:hypothetical protein